MNHDIDRARALHIAGGLPLRGEVRINTAKNSVLYLILASLLTKETVVLKDVPKLRDVLTMLEMVRYFGAQVAWQGRDLVIDADTLSRCEAPYELVSKMRASFVALGALLGRCGSARMSMPGGCAFGPRPVDRHIKAFADLGVEIAEVGGDFYATRTAPLRGRAVFEAPTVGGTQNVILASTLGSGEVVIENAALEPEVADLAEMLKRMGAHIRGAGTRVIEITGARSLSGVAYRPLPDRIEAGTFMLAAAATRGRVTLKDVNPAHLEAVTAKLGEAGVRITEPAPASLHVDATGALRPIDVAAVEYPGVPTDLQAPFGAFLATLSGTSVIEDHVYPDRFTHVLELARTGARLELEGSSLTVHGGPLYGAHMRAADIRAGSALVVAALAAGGESVVSGMRYLERGYERLPERLGALGASVALLDGAVLATGTYGD
jgi:UDP-N-acetylglucosamine 1-carboxyvinyltransferase